MFHGHLDYSQTLPLEGRPNTWPWYHGTPRSNNPIYYILLLDFTICEDSTWIYFHRDSTWLMAQSPMTSHYTWWPVSIPNDFRSVMEQPLNNSFGLSKSHCYGSWLVSEVALLDIPVSLLFIKFYFHTKFELILLCRGSKCEIGFIKIKMGALKLNHNNIFSFLLVVGWFRVDVPNLV